MDAKATSSASAQRSEEDPLAAGLMRNEVGAGLAENVGAAVDTPIAAVLPREAEEELAAALQEAAIAMGNLMSVPEAAVDPPSATTDAEARS